MKYIITSPALEWLLKRLEDHHLVPQSPTKRNRVTSVIARDKYGDRHINWVRLQVGTGNVI